MRGGAAKTCGFTRDVSGGKTINGFRGNFGLVGRPPRWSDYNNKWRSGSETRDSSGVLGEGEEKGDHKPRLVRVGYARIYTHTQPAVKRRYIHVPDSRKQYIHIPPSVVTRVSLSSATSPPTRVAHSNRSRTSGVNI